MNYHTNNQKKWLKRATPEELKLFLSKGPASVEMVLETKDLKTKYVPMVRGMRFKGIFDQPEQASREALRVLKNLRQSVQGKTPLDEIGLGIDGKNAEYMARCYDDEFRISTILHLASIIGTSEIEGSFHDLIDDFMDHLFDQGNHHPSVKPLIPDIREEDRDLEREILHEHWLTNGFFGFVISAVTPIYEDDKSYGWGACQSQWFYAETYDQAFELASEWVKQEANHG